MKRKLDTIKKLVSGSQTGQYGYCFMQAPRGWGLAPNLTQLGERTKYATETCDPLSVLKSEEENVLSTSSSLLWYAGAAAGKGTDFGQANMSTEDRSHQNIVKFMLVDFVNVFFLVLKKVKICF